MTNDFKDSAFGKEERLDTLESSFEVITDKVEQIELAGFQDQISAINDKIKELEKILLDICRHSASTAVDELRHTLLLWTLSYLGNNKIEQQKFIDYLNTQSAAAQAEIKLSQSPLVVPAELKKKLRMYCDRHNLQIFAEE